MQAGGQRTPLCGTQIGSAADRWPARYVDGCGGCRMRRVGSSRWC